MAQITVARRLVRVPPDARGRCYFRADGTRPVYGNATGSSFGKDWEQMLNIEEVTKHLKNGMVAVLWGVPVERQLLGIHSISYERVIKPHQAKCCRLTGNTELDTAPAPVAVDGIPEGGDLSDNNDDVDNGFGNTGNDNDDDDTGDQYDNDDDDNGFGNTGNDNDDDDTGDGTSAESSSAVATVTPEKNGDIGEKRKASTISSQMGGHICPPPAKRLRSGGLKETGLETESIDTESIDDASNARKSVWSVCCLYDEE